jgi:hypothetical protein
VLLPARVAASRVVDPDKRAVLLPARIAASRLARGASQRPAAPAAHGRVTPRPQRMAASRRDTAHGPHVGFPRVATRTPASP